MHVLMSEAECKQHCNSTSRLQACTNNRAGHVLLQQQQHVIPVRMLAAQSPLLACTLSHLQASAQLFVHLRGTCAATGLAQYAAADRLMLQLLLVLLIPLMKSTLLLGC
jgi:hypothetical protein